MFLFVLNRYEFLGFLLLFSIRDFLIGQVILSTNIVIAKL